MSWQVTAGLRRCVCTCRTVVSAVLRQVSQTLKVLLAVITGEDGLVVQILLSCSLVVAGHTVLAVFTSSPIFPLRVSFRCGCICTYTCNHTAETQRNCITFRVCTTWLKQEAAERSVLVQFPPTSVTTGGATTTLGMNPSWKKIHGYLEWKELLANFILFYFQFSMTSQIKRF